MKTPDNPILSAKDNVMRNALNMGAPLSFRDLAMTRLAWLPKGGDGMSIKDLLRRESYTYFSDHYTSFDSVSHNLNTLSDSVFKSAELSPKGITISKTTLPGGIIKVTMTRSTKFEVFIKLDYLLGQAIGTTVDIYFKPQDNIVDTTEKLYKIEMNGSEKNGFAVHTIYGSLEIEVAVREVFDRVFTERVFGYKPAIDITTLGSDYYDSSKIYFQNDAPTSNLATLHITAAANETLDTAYIAIAGNSTKVKMVVYEMENGRPKRLIAETGTLQAVSDTPQWVSINLGINITLGKQYTIGILVENGKLMEVPHSGGSRKFDTEANGKPPVEYSDSDSYSTSNYIVPAYINTRTYA